MGKSVKLSTRLRTVRALRSAALPSCKEQNVKVNPRFQLDLIKLYHGETGDLNPEPFRPASGYIDC